MVARIYKKEPESLSRDTDIRKELSDKSMQILALVSSIENEIEIMIPMKETLKLNTIGDYIDKIESSLS